MKKAEFKMALSVACSDADLSNVDIQKLEKRFDMLRRLKASIWSTAALIRKKAFCNDGCDLNALSKIMKLSRVPAATGSKSGIPY